MAEKDIRKVTTVFISGIDKDGLSYPTLALVGLVSHLEGAATIMAPILVKEPQLLIKVRLSSASFPRTWKNPQFCENYGAAAHKMLIGVPWTQNQALPVKFCLWMNQLLLGGRRNECPCQFHLHASPNMFNNVEICFFQHPCQLLDADGGLYGSKLK